MSLFDVYPLFDVTLEKAKVFMCTMITTNSI